MSFKTFSFTKLLIILVVISIYSFSILTAVPSKVNKGAPAAKSPERKPVPDAALRLAASENIPILMYHHIDPIASNHSLSTISPQHFQEDMLYLKAMGYNTIDFGQLIEYNEGRGSLPQNPIIITFDDGYRSNYQYAFPVLKALNMKATISIIGWSVGSDTYKSNNIKMAPHFSWSEAMEMCSTGLVDIQHHTYDMHDDGRRAEYPRKGIHMLTSESEADYRSIFEKDIQKLSQLLKDNIGRTPKVFVYPYGLYNDISEQMLKTMGFKVTLSIREGVNDPKGSLFLMKRINRPHNITSPDFMKKLLELQGKIAEIPFIKLATAEERVKALEQLVMPKQEQGGNTNEETRNTGGNGAGTGHIERESED